MPVIQVFLIGIIVLVTCHILFCSSGYVDTRSCVPWFGKNKNC